MMSQKKKGSLNYVLYSVCPFLSMWFCTVSLCKLSRQKAQLYGDRFGKANLSGNCEASKLCFSMEEGEAGGWPGSGRASNVRLKRLVSSAGT